MAPALVILGLALSAAAPVAPSRVFFARAQSSAVTPEEARLIESAVLTAARVHATRYDCVGMGDVQGILDAEAARAALGCDASECASEIADAISAEQLVTTQIGRVGGTWVVTLTRLERRTMQVLAREQIQRAGERADVILQDLPRAVDALLVPPRALSALGVAGVGTLAAGALGLATGGTLVGAALVLHADGLALHDQGDLEGAAAKRALGEPLYYVGYALVGAGGAAVVLGGVLWSLGLE